MNDELDAALRALGPAPLDDEALAELRAALAQPLTPDARQILEYILCCSTTKPSPASAP